MAMYKLLQDAEMVEIDTGSHQRSTSGTSNMGKYVSFMAFFV